MPIFIKRFTPVLLILFVFSLVGVGLTVDHADARSRSGGRSFSRSRTYRPPVQRQSIPNKSTNTNRSGSFMRGLGGGLLGGAIGSMLFGGLGHAGMGGGIGGSGIGLFQILLFAGAGYFIYKRFFKRPSPGYAQHHQAMTGEPTEPLDGMTRGDDTGSYPPPPPSGGSESIAEGVAVIRRSEPDFDPEYFKEVAQDVFFQVQAGWMRRDLQSYRNLLGERLAMEYEGLFAELRQHGHINKLENIAIRKVEMVDAGADGNEEFVVVLFTANLLDYTVDEHSGAVVKGSMTEPVKFAEKWTWARPIGTQNWKLEGIDIVNG